jgi:hypothetical protein
LIIFYFQMNQRRERGSINTLADQDTLATAPGADSRIDLSVLQSDASDTTTALSRDQEDRCL